MKELCKKFGTPDRTMSAKVLSLQRQGLLIRRDEDIGTVNWRKVYATILPTNPVKLAKKYSKNVMGVWL
jgi:predicted DNA-binding transcriptional regulator